MADSVIGLVVMLRMVRNSKDGDRKVASVLRRSSHPKLSFSGIEALLF